MDDAGNILIKRVSKCNVYVKSTGQDDENAIGNEILKLPGCALEPEKPVKVSEFVIVTYFTKHDEKHFLDGVQICVSVPAVRHEKIPIERQSRVTSRLP